MKLIINKDDKTATTSEVGGKGYSLINLTVNQFNVPSFFMITSTLFEDFLRFNDIFDKVITLYKDNNINEIQQLIQQSQFSPEIENLIFNEYAKLDTEKVSVRSSGTIEDSSDKSCAGQFKTFLNVDKNTLLDSIKKCFSSFYSTNLKSYLNAEDVSGSMAVVVQKMIDSEYSGVSFTTDYVEQNSNFCIIEAVRGVGEGLVSGEITPTKYCVRKSNNFIDFIIGENQNIETYIEQIAQISAKIEKLYDMPMDIEWAICNKQIYILQARPIVGKMKFKIPFNYVMSRPRPLFMMQIVQNQSFEGLGWFFDGLYYFKPIHIFKDGKFEEYANMYSIEENPDCMLNYLKQNNDNIKDKVAFAYDNCKQIEKMILGQEKFDIDKFINSFTIFGANNTVSNLIEHTTNINKSTIKLDPALENLIISNREFYDEVKYKADAFVEKYVKAILPQHLLPYVNILTIDEIFKNKPVTIQELDKRNQGFIYYDKQVFTLDVIQDFCKENSFIINLKSDTKIDKSQNIIKGNVAYIGNVTGRVKIVNSDSELDKVQFGDIIVSAMTVPTYIEAMKRAAAFVTDEGGTVCHAALIARELKKPCIVGTKIATLALKDNMLLEVNADLGYIKIINEDN